MADGWAKPAELKKISLKTDIKDLAVHGDRDSLVDLVSILLDNAIKYSSKNGQVSLSVGKKDKSAVLIVKDNGQGIRAVDLPHIFDRFFRADSSRSKDSSDGYGLGLAIARKIADLHDASLEVKSTVGKGSTFTVRLPQV